MTNQRPEARALHSAPDPLELICAASFLSVRETVQAAIQHLEALLDPKVLPKIETELVMAEALNNIVEHGYADNPDGKISVGLSVDDSGIEVATRDQGVPMPGLTIPQPQPAETDVTLYELPEGGFGWSLIHMMTSSREYTRNKDTNHLRFVIPLS